MPTCCSYDAGLRLVAIRNDSGIVYSPPYNFEALYPSWVVNKVIARVECGSMDCFMSSGGTKNEFNVAALVRTGRCLTSADSRCLPTLALTLAGQTRAAMPMSARWLMAADAQTLGSRRTVHMATWSHCRHNLDLASQG